MGEAFQVEYKGFEARTLVREYRFNVREAGAEAREFTLTILNEAFDSRRARFQDSPDICSLKLRREMAASENHPEKTHYRISDAELEEYSTSHWPKAVRSPYSPRPAFDEK